MRKLTIKRDKVYAGCLAKVQVYVVDPEQGTLTINGERCRELGFLKNGKETTFYIEDHAVRIYAVFDKLSRNYSSEFWDIEAGTEEVRLSGKVYMDSFNGNAFRFNGIPTPEVMEYRKKTAKKSMTVRMVSIVVAVVVGVLIGTFSNWLDTRVEPKTFTMDELSITLDTGFEEYDVEGFKGGLDSDHVGVLVTEESKAELKLLGLEVNSLAEYGELLAELYEVESDVTTEQGITYFEYTWNDMVEGDYHYVCTLYETTDSYWMVEFVTTADEAEEYRSKIFEWANGVTIAEGNGADSL